MPADVVHLVRHGEVDNPTKILYGRLPGFGLSPLGHRMAAAAADSLAGRPITALITSPLQRAEESAAPWAARFELEPRLDDRVIEPMNRFQGINVRRDLRSHPELWPYLLAPWRPSWGEAYREVVKRMRAAIGDASASVDSGEVVIVTHQLPIWMVALSVAGKPLPHDPRARRCALSSITSVAVRDGRFVEVGYSEPAAELAAGATDLGAV